MDQTKKEERILKQNLSNWKRGQYSPFKLDHKDMEKALEYFRAHNINTSDLEKLYKTYQKTP